MTLFCMKVVRYGVPALAGLMAHNPQPSQLVIIFDPGLRCTLKPLCENASPLPPARASEFGVQALACPPPEFGVQASACAPSEFGVQASACPSGLTEARPGNLNLDHLPRTSDSHSP